MKIRYSVDPERSASFSPPSSERSRRETVIVISLRRTAVDGDGRSRGDEVRISDEALARDRQVRSHESAHLASLGGAAASGVSYDYAVGPGGERIAVGGKIAVDLSEVPGDPAATLRKARTIIAAANAPADPSAADLRTAAEAYRLAAKAAEDIRRERESSAPPIP